MANIQRNHKPLNFHLLRLLLLCICAFVSEAYLLCREVTVVIINYMIEISSWKVYKCFWLSEILNNTLLSLSILPILPSFTYTHAVHTDCTQDKHFHPLTLSLTSPQWETPWARNLYAHTNTRTLHFTAASHIAAIQHLGKYCRGPLKIDQPALASKRRSGNEQKHQSPH